MQKKIENLTREGKEFLRMKRDYDGARFPEAGTAAYAISTEWLAKYKKYCFYDELKRNAQPRAAQDHFTKRHPGIITNRGLLHHEAKFLKGTGTVAGFEPEVMDTYLHKDVRERVHFDFVNEEIWEFLKSRYDCDHAIKRYYIAKGSYCVYNELDARMKLIPTCIVRADDLYAGRITADTFKVSTVQMGS